MEGDLELREQQRALRGSVIRALHQVYGRTPDALGLESIRRVCGVGRSREETRLLQMTLQTVIDLGYVQRDAPQRDALDHDPQTVFRLTGKGALLLTGDVADAAIGL